MNTQTPKNGMGSVIFILISIVSLLGISATYVLASETLFLPLIFYQSPSLTSNATISPAHTATPTQTQEGTPSPSATPQPPDTLQLRVSPSNPDKDWALAFFAKSYNGAGRPVMQIYPGDSSPDSERIKIPRGEIVLALDTPVTADGGGKYWQLVEYEGKGGEELFLKAVDVTKVTLIDADLFADHGCCFRNRINCNS